MPVHANGSRDPISEINNTKRASGVTQVLEPLPSKCEALSSNFYTTENKQTKSINNLPGLMAHHMPGFPATWEAEMR
jgi:hypothetical protein